MMSCWGLEVYDLGLRVFSCGESLQTTLSSCFQLPPLVPWIHRVCFESGAEGPFPICSCGDCRSSRRWNGTLGSVGPLEKIPAQQGCCGQLSHVLPARLDQLLWSQDSNPSLVTVLNLSFTSFVSGGLVGFAGLLSSCPRSICLAGCEHCKGLGGNVWSIHIIVLSPSSLCDGSGWPGERTGPSQNTSDVNASHRSGRFALHRLFTPALISTTHTAHER